MLYPRSRILDETDAWMQTFMAVRCQAAGYTEPSVFCCFPVEGEVNLREMTKLMLSFTENSQFVSFSDKVKCFFRLALVLMTRP